MHHFISETKDTTGISSQSLGRRKKSTDLLAFIKENKHTGMFGVESRAQDQPK